jgi:DHA2 family multidrug resistance protein-like MFS transporter
MLEQTKGYRNRWIALAFMGVSLLVISLDNTVLNLALPSIASDLGSSASQLQWIVDAYILSIAGLLLTIGYLGDRLGRKPTLMAGLGVFALFSLGAALSNSTGMLIGMRAMMGIGAATILPATLSILTATFREPKERAQAIALWAAVFSLGMGIGPVVGGWLLDNFHWSSVFYINIPIVAIGLIGGYKYIENSKSDKPRKIDVPGAVLSIGGFFALVYAIIQAGMDGWTAAHVLYAFGAAAVLLASFIFWELKYRDAMLPLHFFRNMSFTGANVALTLVSFGLMGSFFFLGQFLQSVQGYTPLEAGVRLLPMAAVSFAAAAGSARIADYIGTKFTVGLGIFIAAVGFFDFARVAAVDVSYVRFVIPMCVTALGIGCTMSPATNSVMGSIPVGQSGIGSALNSTTRQIGGALGVAVLGTIMNSTYIAKINAVTWPAQLPAQAIEAIRNSIQGAHIVAEKVPYPQLSQMIIDQSNQAFTSGSEHALIIAAIIMAVSAVLTIFILPTRVRAPKEEEQLTPATAGQGLVPEINDPDDPVK